MECANAGLMRAEMEAVLAEPVFMRSPVQSRLLRYLVEASIRGEGAQLKSYAIAVDGLGKSADFDSQADSYARVQVVRLRRTLDTVYAASQRPHRLVIGNGTYEVTLATTAAGTVAQAASDEQAQAGGDALPGRIGTGRAGGKWRLLALIALVTGLAVVALVQMLVASAESDKAWKQSDFPFVSILVSANAEAGDTALVAEAEAARRTLLASAAHYEGIRTSSQAAGTGDYAVDVVLRRNGTETFADVLVIRGQDRRVIWSASERLEPLAADGGAARARALGALLFRIAQPTGVIHAHERRWMRGTRSPYRCWLRFGLMLQENPFRDDDQFDDCAADWYAATPNHPVAAALQGWALASKANKAVTQDGRRRQLAEALSLIENARSANPNSPLLHVAAMRAHALGGDRDMVIETAGIVQSLNRDSPDLAGVAGLYLLFFNVEGGERLLDDAIQRHPNPPPWYHIGKFVAAMMKDDPAGAQRALDFMQIRRAKGRSLHLMQAAVAARRGNIDLASAYYREAEAETPVMRIAPELVFQRLPLAPEVGARLRQWLAPVLHEDKPR